MRDIETNIWSSKRKWCVEDPHRSRVDEPAERTRYELRNYKRKITIVRICGENVRWKNCEEGA
jgi:hypothetical protein